jgi:hypothetical protein
MATPFKDEQLQEKSKIELQAIALGIGLKKVQNTMLLTVSKHLF